MAQTNETDSVLIADDDERVRTVLERSLRRLGYEVLVARDGAEALSLAIEQKPKVILTDIRMPEMDGHTLLRRLAHHQVESAVIVMSGHGQMEDVVDVLRGGAVDYLKKPWSPSELVAAMVRAVEIFDKRQRLSKEIVEVPSTTRQAADEAKVGFTAILERLKRGEILVPAVPTLVNEVRVLSRKPEARVDEIVRLIERDQRLATQLLRMSNTVQYARSGKNSDLKAAITRVGLREIEGMVETILAHDCYQVKNPQIRAAQTKVWRYSVARALCMRALAELSMLRRAVAPEIAYIAGLLSDLGASFLLWLISERSASASPESCISFMRQHHEEIGALVLERWDVDPIVVLLSRTHHATAPPAPPSPYWSLEVLAQSIADRIAPGDDVTCATRHEAALVESSSAELGIGMTTIEKMYEQLRCDFEDTMASLS